MYGERPGSRAAALVLALFLVAIGIMASRDTAFAANSIETPDSAGCVGLHTSIALDTAGRPVVSYTECSAGLKLLHCGDPTCSSGNSIQSVDTSAGAKYHTSVAIDSSGRPVVAYYDNGGHDLKLLRCGNANCTAGNTIMTPDSAGDVGNEPSLVLDSANRPVISYDDDGPALNVLHCGDATCSSGNTIAQPDSGLSYQSSSIALDSGGNPVVSYYEGSQGVLKVLHCANPTCTSASNSVQTADADGIVGLSTSLKLDPMGRPVIAYRDYTNSALKLMFCGNANCTAGNTTLSVAGHDGLYVSLALRKSNEPIVSEEDNGTLTIVSCNSPQCATGYQVERPDAMSGQNGGHSALALDMSGNPVVSYAQTYDPFFNLVGDLKVLHCSDYTCAGLQSVGGFTTLAQPAQVAGSGDWWVSLLMAVVAGAAVALAVAALALARGRRLSAVRR